jgi:hypothetical protein
MWRAMRTHEGGLTAPLRALMLLLQLSVATAAAPTQLLFNFTSLRENWATTIQLSEIRFYDASGVRITVSVATNPGGTAPYGGQVPRSAIDDNLLTKWTDVDFDQNGHSALYLTPAPGSNPIASCEHCCPRSAIPMDALLCD